MTGEEVGMNPPCREQRRQLLKPLGHFERQEDQRLKAEGGGAGLQRFSALEKLSFGHRKHFGAHDGGGLKVGR